MMRHLCLVITAIFICVNALSQQADRYNALIEEAEKLAADGEYLRSGQKYSEAFMLPGNAFLFIHRYNAVCAWAQAGEIDSSFVQFFIFAQEIYSPENILSFPLSDLHRLQDYMMSDDDLNVLHSDDRWKEIIEIIETNKKAAESNLDMMLVSMLDTIYDRDQNFRYQVQESEKRFGRDSDEMKAQLNAMNRIDSVNLVLVREILDKRGWLGPDVIGYQGTLTLWLVIQHAHLEVQQQYLPMIQDAVGKGNAKPEHLALLEDRIAVREGRKQMYGSQIGFDPETGEFYVPPIVDPDNLDRRRSEVGLNSFQEYISDWGLTWDLEEYKKLLPELEVKHKNIMLKLEKTEH